MIRDRGRIKWNSLMLPEHVKLLRGWAEEDRHEQQRQLDEQKQDCLNEVAVKAMESEQEVSITYFANNHYEQMIGKIQSFDAVQNEFRMIDKKGDIHRISLKSIKEIE